MKVYYNEIDAYCCAWMSNLMDAGHIAPGRIDDRSIVDVRRSDLVGYDRLHFFAGIAGWELAARLAGWPPGLRLVTGSCPCQPFSAIGKRKGVEDERHLWPVFFDLVRGFPVVVGEQVASPDGRDWLAGVRDDMERAGYVFGAANLCSAGVSAPHIRQRLHWVGYTDDEGLEGHPWHGRAGRVTPAVGPVAEAGRTLPWNTFDAITDIDGKTRRVERGVAPMAYRLPGHVDQLKAYGNAINPHLAAQFLASVMECLP